MPGQTLPISQHAEAENLWRIFFIIIIFVRVVFLTVFKAAHPSALSLPRVPTRAGEGLAGASPGPGPPRARRRGSLRRLALPRPAPDLFN